ncbi:DinB family protein [Paenibacillus kobensis]|uniref:DinB family protein n=1 Tax=Paenibacillus kobensis TaxID=59841 RepID=UPI000FDBC44A|nr:DinB family protein [Paenibacillus kobensis]
MNEWITQLYQYNVWANDRVLQHLQSLPANLFHQEVDLGFRSIAEAVGHLAAADEVWFARIQEQAPPPLSARVFSDVEEARRHRDELQSRMRLFLSNTDVQKRVTYSNTAGQSFTNSIAEIIQQVVNHGTYHRGNVTTILRSLGYNGTMTDFIAFIRTL